MLLICQGFFLSETPHDYHCHRVGGENFSFPNLPAQLVTPNTENLPAQLVNMSIELVHDCGVDVLGGWVFNFLVGNWLSCHYVMVVAMMSSCYVPGWSHLPWAGY